MAKKCKKCNAVWGNDITKCPLCDSKKLEEFDDKAEFIAGVIAFGVIAVIVVIILFAITGVGDDNYTDEELEQAGKWRECWNRSNTYYKCDWSHSEDRCVCKQR